MKSMPIDMVDLMASFEATADLGFEWHLDLHTGEVLQLFAGDPGIVGEDVVEAEQPLRDRLDAEPERYEQVPFASTREDFEVMERFAAGQPDERLRRALVGKGAFRRFREEVHALRLQAEWDQFRAAQVELRARAWLERLGITAPPRVQAPPSLPTAPAPPTLPGLVELLLLGATEESPSGKVTRAITANSPQVARRYFSSVARSICEHVGEDWRKRFVEDTDEFARDRFSLRVEGKRVLLTVVVDPSIRALFG